MSRGYCRPSKKAGLLRNKTFLFHQSPDPLTTTVNALVQELVLDSHRAVTLAAGKERRPYKHLEFAIFSPTLALWSSSPGVETARRHFQYPTHQAYRVLSAVFLDELIPHRFWSEKIATAFFKMSRSSLTRASSLLTRRSSSSSVLNTPLPRNASSPSISNSRTHLRSMSARIPKSSATSFDVRPSSRAKRTASFLNSWLYSLLRFTESSLSSIQPSLTVHFFGEGPNPFVLCFVSLCLCVCGFSPLKRTRARLPSGDEI